MPDGARSDRDGAVLGVGAAGDVLIDLVDVAEAAIHDGLVGRPLRLPPAEGVPAVLGRPAASFVTLHVGDDLNGCIGSLAANEPLVHSVARHARSAAFDDPRLPPLRNDDLDGLRIEISILSPLVGLEADSRTALVAALRPRVDGLVVDVGGRRAVFLPTVWATLPAPDRFVAELFAKAGLDAAYWGSDVDAWTFTTTKVARGAPGRDPATVR